MSTHAPQALKQTYGCQCQNCGELWDGYQVPCPIDVALRAMKANRSCWKCGSRKVLSLMPWKYEELKAVKFASGATSDEASNG